MAKLLSKKFKRRLDENQISRLSNIFDNAGNIIFGATVLTPVISDFDRVSWLVVILGSIGVCFCWMLSVWLSGRIK